MSYPVVTFSAHPDQLEGLKEYSKKQRQSMSTTIRQALDMYLKAAVQS